MTHFSPDARAKRPEWSRACCGIGEPRLAREERIGLQRRPGRKVARGLHNCFLPRRANDIKHKLIRLHSKPGFIEHNHRWWREDRFIEPARAAVFAARARIDSPGCGGNEGRRQPLAVRTPAPYGVHEAP